MRIEDFSSIQITQWRIENDDNDTDDTAPEKKSKKHFLTVYFDLETNGIDHKTRHENIQICSIAASTDDGEDSFESFLIPTEEFQPGATRLNGMELIDGKLYKHNRLVEKAVPMKKGLKMFLRWLYGLLDNNDNIVLVRGHLNIPTRYLKIIFMFLCGTTDHNSLSQVLLLCSELKKVF